MKLLYTILALSLLTQVALADYAPNLGRFTQRDPIGEPGMLASPSGSTYSYAVKSSQAANKGIFVPRDPVIRAEKNRYAFVYNQAINSWDWLGLDVWVENTDSKRARGFHRRVCVDEWIGPFDSKPTNTDFEVCCIDGKWYAKPGWKYCISFGVLEGNGSSSGSSTSESSNSSDSSNSSNSEASSSPSSNDPLLEDMEDYEYEGKPFLPYPDMEYPFPSGKEENDLADGEVYVDIWDKATKEPFRWKTNCCKQDIATLQYMKGLVGKKADYSFPMFNCRHFSKAVLDHAQKEFKNLCDEE